MPIVYATAATARSGARGSGTRMLLAPGMQVCPRGSTHRDRGVSSEVAQHYRVVTKRGRAPTETGALAHRQSRV